MSISRPFGIDLGTTNSCVAIMNESHTDVIIIDAGEASGTTPSCVWHDPESNEVVVGRDAYIRRGSLPAPVVSVKRSMGTQIFIPLGKASKIPSNVPPAVKRALSETRDERLERYLARLEGANPKELKAIREKKRANPPKSWVMDQRARLQYFLRGIDDPEERARAETDPPLLWLPEEISALILAEESRQVQARMRTLEPDNVHSSNRCLITVPAYFGHEQKEATKEAGVLAGLEVLELLQEPSAAATYYCWKARIQNGIFLVFDLGGGTFDVSLLRLQSGWPEVLGISGDNLLGGDDFDRALAERIRSTLVGKSSRYDLALRLERPEDRNIWNAFVVMAEGVKKALSREPTYLLRDTAAFDRKEVRLHVDMKIARKEFETLIAPLIDKCIPKCWEAIAKAKLRTGNVSLSHVDEIFLVGGATHVPLVQRAVIDRLCASTGARPYLAAEIESILEEMFGDDPNQTQQLRAIAREMMQRGERAKCTTPTIDNPDLCVALGAAIGAARYGEKVQDGEASLIITSPKNTSQSTTMVTGRVVGCDESRRRGAGAQLSSEKAGVELESDVMEDGSFVFPDVPLRFRGENVFDLNICTANGEELLRSSITIEQVAQGEARTLGASSSATVSLPYTLDVVKNGVIQRKTLVPSGASLPIKRQTYELVVPDPNTGVIYFKLFQGFRLLKCIEAFLDPTIKPGTCIIFTFSIGQDHLMRATYRIAEDPEEHPVVIEPPDNLCPTEEELAQVREGIDQELELLGAIDRKTFNMDAEKLYDDIAQHKDDEARVIARYEQLKRLREEIIQKHTFLKPPLSEFEKTYRDCLALLNALKREQPDYPDEDERKTLTLIWETGKAAYADKNKAQYDKERGELQGRLESLSKEYQRFAEASPESMVRRAGDLVKDGLEKARKLLSDIANVIDRIEDRAEDTDNPEHRSTLLQHAAQARQCRENVDQCEKEFLRLQVEYTKNAKEAIDNCYGLFPILHNAQGVLQQKQHFLDGKLPADQKSVLPWVR